MATTCALTLGVSACLCVGKVHAQRAVADDYQLEEVVVTATRRSETIDKVPISIVALDRETMTESGVKGISDLAALTPGLEFDNATGLGAGTVTNIAIRGVDSPVGASTTGIYLDDTAIQGRLTNSSAFGSPYPVTFDLDRVEVLRGPQGTLFGAGAEGGAVRFIMAEPSTTKFSGRALAEIAHTKGGAASYEFGAAAGGPIIDNTLGFRASAWHRKDGGYVDHVDPFTGAVTDANSNYSESSSARLALTVKATDSVRITPSLYWQRVMNHDTAAFYRDLSDPGRGTFQNGRLLRQPSNDSFYLASLKIDADLGFGTLVNVTSYFDRHAKTVNDITNVQGALGSSVFLPLGSLGYGNPRGPEYPASYADAAPQFGSLSQRMFSEELRIASSDPTARLLWVAGLYYSDSHQADPNTLYQADLLPITQYVLFQNNVNHDRQSAVFGQADLTIVSGLKLTGGVRVARLTSDNLQANLGLLSGGDAIYQQSSSETPVTPKFSLTYSPSDRSLYYASASKGYRLGGANVPFGSQCVGANIPLSFSPDSVWSYEIGAKNRLFNDRMQISTSAYHLKWRNIQQGVLIANCNFQYVANTGEAASNGFDVAAQMLLSRQLTATVLLAYTDAHFTKSTSSGGIPIVRSGDVVGALPQVGSPWSATGSVEYRFQIAGYQTHVRLEDVFHSRNPGPFISQIPGGLSYNPDLVSNPRTNVVNIRATMSVKDYDVSLYVNNMFNSVPRLGRYVDVAGSTLFTESTLRPTTVGLSLALRF